MLTIPGWNYNEVETLDPNAKDGGRHPFPCTSNGWTKHTATVEKAEIKTNEHTGQSKILLTVTNGRYGDSIWIELDPRNVGNAQDTTKALQQNLDRLMLAAKVLGCATRQGIDEHKLVKASGQVVQISVKATGTREYQGKYYHQTRCYLDGLAPELLPVDERTGWPPLPGAAPATPAADFDPSSIGF